MVVRILPPVLLGNKKVGETNNSRGLIMVLAEAFARSHRGVMARPGVASWIVQATARRAGCDGSVGAADMADLGSQALECALRRFFQDAIHGRYLAFDEFTATRRPAIYVPRSAASV